MMRRCLWFALLLLCVTPTYGQTVVEGRGDLYVLHTPEGGVRIVSAPSEEQVMDIEFERLPDDLVLHYFAADPQSEIDFRFKLHTPLPRPADQPLPEKTLVVSDLHGNLAAFVALLKGSGVVDDALDWRYGANRLVFAGDMLDRGRDDNGIAWLLYKLSFQAAEAGGRVDVLQGNHEDLVLKNDLRYVHPAHTAFAEKAYVPYAELYGPRSELGRWIRGNRLVVKAGDIVFVHAGLSRPMADSLYTADEMNALGAQWLGIANNERREAEPRTDQLFGSQGPLWYRALVRDSKKYPGAPSDDLDATLAYYGARRMIVGHSEVAEIESRYGGLVVAINVDHTENFAKKRTAALLIENGTFHAVDYDGDKQPLPM
jgi:hypothetical protein